MHLDIQVPLITGSELEEFICLHLFRWIKSKPARYIASPENNFCWTNSHGRHMHDATVFTSPTITGFQWVISEMTSQGWSFSCNHAISPAEKRQNQPGKYTVQFEQYIGAKGRRVLGKAEHEDMSMAVCRAVQVALLVLEKMTVNDDLLYEVRFVEPEVKKKKVLT